MTIEEAIKKASKGGWKHDNYCDGLGCGFSMIFLDPLFWSSLGKAMYDKNKGTEWHEKSAWNWKHYWHKFIDHLAEGKTAEDYFKSL